MSSDVIYGAVHPETYYAKWNQLYAREQRLRREMNAAPDDKAKSEAWQRAFKRLGAHEATF